MEKSKLWTPELSTGIDWQDFQHQKFLRYIDQMFKAFHEQIGHLDIKETTQTLTHYAEDHFGIEETYMKKYQYPDLKNHIQEHGEFRRFLREIQDTGQNSLMESARLCHKLNGWFVDHIVMVDQKLGTFLQSKSLH